MKAKEWAARFASPDLDSVSIAGIMGEFCQEVIELTNKRGHTEAAADGAVREQLQKWDAVCRLGPKNEDGEPRLDVQLFLDALEYTYPALYKTWAEAETRRYERSRIKVIQHQYQRRLAEIKKEPNAEVRWVSRLAALWEKMDEQQELRDFLHPKPLAATAASKE